MNCRKRFLLLAIAGVYVALSVIFMWPPVVLPDEPCGNACVNNLRQIVGAKEQWAIENNKSGSDPVAEAEVNRYIKTVPQCPKGGKYTYNAVGVLPTCSLGTGTPTKEWSGFLRWKWSENKRHRLEQ
jgi:hypothetical protein